MRKFFLQQLINGKLCQSIFSEVQLISYLDMSDCYDDEYKIFDVSVSGQIREVFCSGWVSGCLIEIVNGDGNVAASGYGTDH